MVSGLGLDRMEMVTSKGAWSLIPRACKSVGLTLIDAEVEMVGQADGDKDEKMRSTLLRVMVGGQKCDESGMSISTRWLKRSCHPQG